MVTFLLHSKKVMRETLWNKGMIGKTERQDSQGVIGKTERQDSQVTIDMSLLYIIPRFISVLKRHADHPTNKEENNETSKLGQSVKTGTSGGKSKILDVPKEEKMTNKTDSHLKPGSNKNENDVGTNPWKFPLKKVVRTNKFNEDEETETTRIWKSYPELIKTGYEPCNAVKPGNAMVIKIMRVLSHYQPFKRLCEAFIDEIFNQEKKIHKGDEGNALSCLYVHKENESYLSAWIRDIVERNGPISNIIKKMLDFFQGLAVECSCNCLGRAKESISEWGRHTIEFIEAIIRIALFYRDFMVDIIIICVIYHLDNSILRYLSNEERYQSVAGINLRFLWIYLIIILLSSEAWFLVRAFRKRNEFAKLLNVSTDEYIALRCFRFSVPLLIIVIFPIHACILGEFKINFEIRQIHRKVKEIMEQDESNEEDMKEISAEIIKLTRRIDELLRNRHRLNEFCTGIQVIGLFIHSSI